MWSTRARKMRYDTRMTDATLLTDEQVREFIVNGFLVLKPDVDQSVHQEIDTLLRYSYEHETWLGNNVVSRIPKMHDVLRSPVVHGALTSVAGPNYYLHPHRAVHASNPVEDRSVELTADVDGPKMGKGSSSGSNWHQDGQTPLSRARHHLPRYLIGFYFPHETPLAMGPTRLQAGSYLFAHPAAPQAVVLPELVEAGTFVLAHFDMLHAGFPNLMDAARFMVKFVFVRTERPTAPSWHNLEPEWRHPTNCLPEFDLSETWSFIWHWLRGEPRAMANATAVDEHLARLNDADQVARLRSIYVIAAENASDSLGEALESYAGQNKHQRRHKRDENGQPLPRDDMRGWPRRWNERAIVMEDAAYALAASRAGAIPTLWRLLEHDDPWVQINAVFALGENGAASKESVGHIVPLLASPHQQVVRQALDALGAIGCGLAPALPAIERLLTETNTDWQELQVERGWVGEDQVRFNAASALLNAVNAGEELDHIERILTACLGDENGYLSAVATEALVRIGTPHANTAAIRFLSDRRWDDTLRGLAKPF